MFLQEKGNVDTDRCTGRTQCEDRGRDWCDVPTGQGMPRIASYQQKLGQRHRTGSVLELLEGTNLANILL